MFTLNHLPDGILLQILTFLESHPLSLDAISQVNKKLNQLKKASPSQKKLQERKQNNLISIQHHQKFLEELEKPGKGGSLQAFYQIVEIRHQNRGRSQPLLNETQEKNLIEKKIKKFYMEKAHQLLQYWFLTFDELLALTQELLQETNAAVTVHILYDLMNIKPFVQKKWISLPQCYDYVLAHTQEFFYTQFEMLANAINVLQHLIEKNRVDVSDLIRFVLTPEKKLGLSDAVQAMMEYQSLLESYTLNSQILLTGLIHAKDSNVLIRLKKATWFFHHSSFNPVEVVNFICQQDICPEFFDVALQLAPWVPSLVSASQLLAYGQTATRYGLRNAYPILPLFQAIHESKQKGIEVSFLKQYHLRDIIKLLQGLQRLPPSKPELILVCDLLEYANAKGLQMALHLVKLKKKPSTEDLGSTFDFGDDEVLMKENTDVSKETLPPARPPQTETVVSSLIVQRNRLHAEINQTLPVPIDAHDSAGSTPEFSMEPNRGSKLWRVGLSKCSLI